MTHYPVTTSFWRGVWGHNGDRFVTRLRRPIVRACDWRTHDPSELTESDPTCKYCIAYKQSLQRMGYVR